MLSTKLKAVWLVKIGYNGSPLRLKLVSSQLLGPAVPLFLLGHY